MVLFKLFELRLCSVYCLGADLLSLYYPRATLKVTVFINICDDLAESKL